MLDEWQKEGLRNSEGETEGEMEPGKEKREGHTREGGWEERGEEMGEGRRRQSSF